MNIFTSISDARKKSVHKGHSTSDSDLNIRLSNELKKVFGFNHLSLSLELFIGHLVTENNKSVS